MKAVSSWGRLSALPPLDEAQREKPDRDDHDHHDEEVESETQWFDRVPGREEGETDRRTPEREHEQPDPDDGPRRWIRYGRYPRRTFKPTLWLR